MSRLLEGPIALPFVNQLSLFVKRGMAGATGNWYCGLHEFEDMALVLHVLRHGDRFLDIGANVGSYSLLAAATGANVVAVEPIPHTFEDLERNIRLNRLENVVDGHCMGVSEQTGSLRFTSGLGCVNHVVSDEEDPQDTIEVPVARLDDMVGSEIPTVMKIDVEGHERSVLMGGGDTLNDDRLMAVIMETNGSGRRYGTEDDELVRMMLNFGLVPVKYDPFKRQLTEAKFVQGGNTIFVRDLDWVQQRVETADRFGLVNGYI